MNAALKNSGTDWYLGEQSLADPYLYVLCRRTEQTALSIDDYPALKAHRQHMEEDEGIKIALERQGMESIDGTQSG